jgi:hypothetical protein
VAEKRKRTVRSEKKPTTIAVDAQANLIELDADTTNLPDSGRRAFSIGPQGEIINHRHFGDEAAEDDVLKGGSGAENDLATLASSFSEESTPTRPTVLSRQTRDVDVPLSEVSKDVHHKMDGIIEEIVSSKDREMEVLQARVADAERRVASAEEKLMEVQSAKAQLQGLEKEALSELQIAHEELTVTPHHEHHHIADYLKEQGDIEERDATPPMFEEATGHR